MLIWIVNCLLAFVFVDSVISMLHGTDKIQTHYDEHGAFVIPMADHHYLDLYKHWTAQSISSVMSVIAHQDLEHQPHDVKNEFYSCTKRAKDVHLHARCLSKLWDGKFDPIKQTGRQTKSQRLEQLRYRKPNEWIGGFRTRQRRSIRVQHRNGYELRGTRHESISPLGFVARSILKGVLASKNRTQQTSWQEVVERAKVIHTKTENERKQMLNSEEEDENDGEETKMFRGISDQLKSEIHKVANPYQHRWSKTRKISNSGSPQNRQRDQKPADPKERLSQLLRDGIRLGYSLTGGNLTGFDDKPLRVMSPRFLSVMPETESQNGTINLVSPSLLSLHNEGRGLEQLTSLPNLLHGFGDEDQQAWLNLIVESAGVREELDKLEDIPKPETSTTPVVPDLLSNLPSESYPPTGSPFHRFHDAIAQYKREAFKPNGQPLYFTKKNATRIYGSVGARRIETWLALQSALSQQQLNELNRTGMATMTGAQLHMLYGPQSPYNNSEALNRLHDVVVGKSQHEHRRNMQHTVRQFAEAESFNLKRQKDVVGNPIVFSPILPGITVNSFVYFSPLVFSPLIGVFTILGPLILSPWIFTPLILSPKLMSPIIISPFLFSPTILSPYALHPVILSPGVFNPLILSPLLLGPSILSPQAFTPFILSPYVLSPVILSPSVASPLVLSPFVLSPTIFSPQAFSGLILSPYALSPVVFSKLYFFRLILSPSILS
ncbi:hypothetical protein M3Y95_00276000 [Aphelenchoides besseyi]|nr:hypothetical protein M3Y95_00276000 [Aphelenchoides besseyi]